MSAGSQGISVQKALSFLFHCSPFTAKELNFRENLGAFSKLFNVPSDFDPLALSFVVYPLLSLCSIPFSAAFRMITTVFGHF
jgi:hypothetical protein